MASELEYKFSFLGDHFPSFAELRQLFEPNYVLRSPRSRHQHDAYYDDRIFSLERAGYALRMRTVNGKRFATLKSRGQVEGARHLRDELEIPLTNLSFPDIIQIKIWHLVEIDNLDIHLELNTHRIAYQLEQHQQPVAELVFDEVSAKRPRSDASVHFSEMELEALRDASDAHLEAILLRLEGISELGTSAVSKLERAKVLLSFADAMQEDEPSLPN